MFLKLRNAWWLSYILLLTTKFSIINEIDQIQVIQAFSPQNFNNLTCQELHNEDIQIKNAEYLQHLHYNRKSQKGYQQNCGVFCGFLDDSNLHTTAEDIVFPSVHQM